MFLPRLRTPRPPVASLLLLLILSGAACQWTGTSRPLQARLPDGTCRALVPSVPGESSVAVEWVTPREAVQVASLNRWCNAVGPVVAITAADSREAGVVDELAILTWNVHVGAGDIETVVRRLRSGTLTGGQPMPHFVLLLQEAHRAGAAVPRVLGSSVELPGAILPGTPGRPRQDVAAVAARLNLHLYYVPSMRNGRPLETNEDRGNAILSTLPLSSLAAIELPFERQRRVTIAAEIGARTSRGEPWSFTVVSTHLDNLVGLRSAWIFAGPARQRQARGVVDALPAETPAIVGGDLNSWFGYRDPAYLEFARSFPGTPRGDTRPTFGGLLRLDHLFFRLPDGWSGSHRRLDDRFGSDHHPVLGIVRRDGGVHTSGAVRD
jgi:endonuclease/exonuclease/phosphatase family metal-dependent hydrolase